jgi:hypothetical protein
MATKKQTKQPEVQTPKGKPKSKPDTPLVSLNARMRARRGR